MLTTDWNFATQHNIDGDLLVCFVDCPTGSYMNLSNSKDRPYHRQYGVPFVEGSTTLIHSPSNYVPVSGSMRVSFEPIVPEPETLIGLCTGEHWYDRYAMDSGGWNHSGDQAYVSLNFDPSVNKSWYKPYLLTYEYNAPVRLEALTDTKLVCILYQHDVYDWKRNGIWIKAGKSVTVKKESAKTYLTVCKGGFDLIDPSDDDHTVHLESESVVLKASEDSLLVKNWLPDAK